MQNEGQKTRKGPKMFTPEEIRMMKAQREKHLKKMETDLEYRKLWEKREAAFDRIALINDSIETK